MIEQLKRDISTLNLIFWILMTLLVLMFWPREMNDCSTVNSVISVDQFIIEKPAVVPKTAFKPRYGFTDDEIYLLTVLLCGSEDIDGDGEYDIDYGLEIKQNYDQIYLPLNIVMNRVRAEGFPNTVAEVIWQPRQFISEIRDPNNLPSVKEESYQIVKDWCSRYDEQDESTQVVPEDHYFYEGNGFVNISRKEW